MPDDKNTGEWPETAKLIVDGNGLVVDWDERALDEDQHERLESYLPLQSIRERLEPVKQICRDEITDAKAANNESSQGPDYYIGNDMRREVAEAVLAALDAAFPEGE